MGITETAVRSRRLSKFFFATKVHGKQVSKNKLFYKSCKKKSNHAKVSLGIFSQACLCVCVFLHLQQKVFVFRLSGPVARYSFKKQKGTKLYLPCTTKMKMWAGWPCMLIELQHFRQKMTIETNTQSALCVLFPLSCKTNYPEFPS